MASQQVLFAETIAGMKKAFKRKSYGTQTSVRFLRLKNPQLTMPTTESDSDSEIESYSNRGNKLKKKARFARQGQLVPNNGPSSYKEVRHIDKHSSPITDLTSMSNSPACADQSFVAILP